MLLSIKTRSAPYYGACRQPFKFPNKILDFFVLDCAILIERATIFDMAIRNHKNTQTYKHSQLESIDLKMVVMAIQYIGLFGAFLLINFMILFSYLINTSQVQRISYSRPMYTESSFQNKLSETKPTKTYLSNVKVLDRDQIKPSKALTALINSQSRASVDDSVSEKRVLGLSVKKAQAQKISACSFKQGGKLYADKAKVVLQKSDLSNSFCVGVKDVSTSKFLWNLNGQTSKGNCLDLLSYNLSSSSNSTPIEINVFVDDSNQSASCSLLIEGIKQ